MPLLLLCVSAAIVMSVVVLAMALHRLDDELSGLRRELRRTTATAVAADELQRDAAVVSRRASELAADARRRLSRAQRGRSSAGR